MVQIEWLIAGINSNARHFVDFVTTTDVLLPIRPGQIDAAKRNQKTWRLRPAFVSETRIDAVHIFGEQRLETAGPRLDDPMFLELCDQCLRVAVLQSSERPVEEIYICVDDSNRFGASWWGLRDCALLRSERNGGSA